MRSRNGHDHVDSYETPDDHTDPHPAQGQFRALSGVLAEDQHHPQAHPRRASPTSTRRRSTRRPIGTGPFKFKERVAGSYIAFEPNANYHGGAPKLTRWSRNTCRTSRSLYAQFQTGEVDIYDLQGIPPLLYSRRRRCPAAKILLSPSPFVEFIYFNCGKPQFTDKAVRKAIYMAIDKKGWIDACLLRRAACRRSATCRRTTGPTTAISRIPASTRPRRPRCWMRRAGRSGSDGVRAKDGVRLAFTMSTTAGNKSREQAQQLVQQNLKKINVEMTIKNMPASVVWGDYTVKSQFDTLMVGWDPLLYPDPDYTDRIASNSDPGQGRQRLELRAVREPGDRRICAPRARRRHRAGGAQADLRPHSGNPARRHAVRADLRLRTGDRREGPRARLRGQPVHADQLVEHRRVVRRADGGRAAGRLMARFLRNRHRPVAAAAARRLGHRLRADASRAGRARWRSIR